MRRSTLLFCISLCLFSCAGNNFDEATIPADQLSTELAFRRVVNHGGLEPVLEENTTFSDWQFHVASKSKTTVLEEEPIHTFHLNDRSGIEYTVNSSSSPANVLAQIGLGYGYASGQVVSVKRDLAGGKFEVELQLTSWRARAH